MCVLTTKYLDLHWNWGPMPMICCRPGPRTFQGHSDYTNPRALTKYMDQVYNILGLRNEIINQILDSLVETKWYCVRNLWIHQVCEPVDWSCDRRRGISFSARFHACDRRKRSPPFLLSDSCSTLSQIALKDLPRRLSHDQSTGSQTRWSPEVQGATLFRLHGCLRPCYKVHY